MCHDNPLMGDNGLPTSTHSKDTGVRKIAIVVDGIERYLLTGWGKEYTLMRNGREVTAIPAAAIPRMMAEAYLLGMRNHQQVSLQYISDR